MKLVYICINNYIKRSDSKVTHIFIAFIAIFQLASGVSQIYYANDLKPANKDPIKVNKSDDVDIRCESSEPIHFLNPSNEITAPLTLPWESYEYIINWDAAKLIEGNYNLTYEQNPSGTYITKLHLKNVDYKSVGFYYCITNQTLINNPSSFLLRENQRVYLSVNDNENSVIVDDGPLWITDSCDVYIPCKPTTNENTVKLFLNKNGHKIEYRRDGLIFPGLFKINNNDLESKNHFICSKVNDSVSKQIEVRVDRICKSTCKGGVTIISKTDNFAVEGGDIELICKYYGKQAWDSTWFLPNNKTAKDRRLIIENASINDIGEYRCVVELRDSYIHTAVLNITTLLPADKPFINYTVHSGSNILESNSGKSDMWLIHYFTSSIPTLTWYNNKNGKIIDSSKTKKYEVFYEENKRWTGLKVKDLNYLDSGNYTLIIEINGLKKTIPLQLRVRSDPLVKIANDFKEEYGYVTKTCTVYGYPSSVINWRICDDSDEKICQNPTDLSVDTTKKSIFEQISTVKFKPTSNVTNIYCDALNVENKKIISDQTHYIKLHKIQNSYLRVYLITFFTILCVIAITLIIYNYKIRKNDFYKLPKSPVPSSMEFPEDKLEYIKKLGSGHYGVVQEAFAEGIKPNEYKTKVAVKTLQLPTDNKLFVKMQMEGLRALMSELHIMRELGKHLNVVEFLGEISKNILQFDLKIIYEYCPYGSLIDIVKEAKFINQIVQTNDGYMIDPSITTDRKEIMIQSNHAINPVYSIAYTLCTPETDSMNEYSSSGYMSTGYTFNESAPSGYSSNVSAPSGYTSNESAPTGYSFSGYNSNINNNISQYNPVNASIEEDANGVNLPIDSNTSNSRSFKTTDYIYFSYQVARGMDYLASRNVFHGDLAARNVLLCENNIVKIADFGLARSLSQCSFYTMKYGTDLPLPWLAIESMRTRKFSIESDVWSFGVFMWELFSLGKMPYNGICEPNVLIEKLIRNDGLKKPDETCPQEMWNIMEPCWNLEPKERPSFSNLVKEIEEFVYKEDLDQYNHLNDLFNTENLTRLTSDDFSDILKREAPQTESTPMELTQMLQPNSDKALPIENNDANSQSKIKFQSRRKRYYRFLNRLWPIIPNIYTQRKN